MRSTLGVVVGLLLLAGCASSSAKPEDAPATQPRTVEVGFAPPPDDSIEIRKLRERLAAQPDDMGARFALGVAYERGENLAFASREYETVARALPRRRWTRPWFAYG